MSYAPEIVVAIIDDHEAIRVGMSAALRASGRFVGVREGAATVGEFLACGSSSTEPHIADVVLLDLNLGDESDPKENAQWFRERMSNIKRSEENPVIMALYGPTQASNVLARHSLLQTVALVDKIKAELESGLTWLRVEAIHDARKP